jgi:hypothetical protein
MWGTKVKVLLVIIDADIIDIEQSPSLYDIPN